MKLLLQNIVLFGGILASLQVRGEAADLEDKRSVSHLARAGQLPSPGKRYLAALAKNGDLASFTRPSWKRKLYEILEDNGSDYSDIDEDKRYVGALAKAGGLKASKFRNEKRDEVDSLIDELVTAEELQLEALREQLLNEQEDDSQDDEIKRSVSSLARSGGGPFVLGKRGIAALAKNGDFPWADGKRGGISSVLRSRFHRKRNIDYNLDKLIDALSFEKENNNLQAAKRNLASFAKSGGLSALSYRNEKKNLYDDWLSSDVENKRNIQSVFRNKLAPFVEGKRYLGAFFASNGRPPYVSRDPTYKRNIGSMARGWDSGDSDWSFKLGKRGVQDFELDDNDYIVKRYVAALLRQGRLPLGNGNFENNNDETVENIEKEDMSELEEQKRHIGSIAAQNSLSMRKKKSIDSNEQNNEIKDSPKVTVQVGGSDESSPQRAKREIYYDNSDEYPMPVLQNTVSSDYEEIMSNVAGDGPSARNKRYFAVRGGGKIPGGRLPQIGSSRRGNHNQNSGRRRGH